jgi:hypothetical protein
MGQAKREIERLERLRDTATDILIKTGAVRVHRRDDSILINEMDEEAISEAYARGTNMVEAGKIDGTRKELMDAIAEVLRDAKA